MTETKCAVETFEKFLEKHPDKFYDLLEGGIIGCATSFRNIKENSDKMYLSASILSNNYGTIKIESSNDPYFRKLSIWERIKEKFQNMKIIK